MATNDMTVDNLVISIEAPFSPRTQQQLTELLHAAFRNRTVWLATFHVGHDAGLEEIDSAPLVRIGILRKAKIVRIQGCDAVTLGRVLQTSAFLNSQLFLLGGESWSNQELRCLDGWRRAGFPSAWVLKESLAAFDGGRYLCWNCPPRSIEEMILRELKRNLG